MTDPTPIAWRAIVYGTPVLAADGAQLGSVREVLGSDADDIFHGLRVRRADDPKRDVMIAAERITVITTDSISTNVARAVRGPPGLRRGGHVPSRVRRLAPQAPRLGEGLRPGRGAGLSRIARALRHARPGCATLGPVNPRPVRAQRRN